MKRIIALGFFDGVHLGHGALIMRANELAVENGCTPSVLTFDSYPLSQVRGSAGQILTSVEDRCRLIGQIYGVKDVIVMPFDRQTMNTPAEDFIHRLQDEFGAAGFVCGYDFRFGKGGAGNAALLKEHCSANGLYFSSVDEVDICGERVSSTLVRRLLSEGEVEEAEKFLGHPHIMTGTATAERVVGSTVVRIVPDSGIMLPLVGVYDTRIIAADGTSCGAVTSVGENGTVSRLFGSDIAVIPNRLTIQFLRFIEV